MTLYLVLAYSFLVIVNLFSLLELMIKHEVNDDLRSFLLWVEVLDDAVNFNISQYAYQKPLYFIKIVDKIL